MNKKYSVFLLCATVAVALIIAAATNTISIVGLLSGLVATGLTGVVASRLTNQPKRVPVRVVVRNRPNRRRL